MNLNEYKDTSGKFVAIYDPLDDFWKTKKGQKYLKMFYTYDEYYKRGFLTFEERQNLVGKL
jgi:hypothetical protein